jgi:N utilization substance protein B
MSDSPNPSLQRKTAARLAAVQCLYQSSVSGKAASASSQVEDLKAKLKDNREEQKLLVGSTLEPNYPLVETILAGVEERREEIDQRLDGALGETWTRQRTGPLLIAILQCGIFELFFGKEIKPTIIIDEYTRLTRRFFSDAEVDFVHATLNTLVKAYG